jgi:hypothetical protein
MSFGPGMFHFLSLFFLLTFKHYMITHGSGDNKNNNGSHGYHQTVNPQ